MRIRDPQTGHRWRAGRSTRSRSGGTRAEVRAIPYLPQIQRQPPPQTDYQTVSFAILEKNWRDRLIRLAARHPDWVVGYADEVWWSRLAQPALHAWGETLRLKAKARAKDDPQPKALACYGLLRTDQDRVLLRFVEGRPVSRVTTDFLAWGADRLAAEGKRVWVLVWDNAAWHVSRAVQAWIGTHNRTVKCTGGVRILVCRLPVKSPWLNPIEPRWLHGKRAVVEPERTLTAHELMDRVHQHFGCERLQPLNQHVS